MSQNKKNRSGIVFSTSTDFEYEHEDDGESETLPKGEQNLRVQLDKKSRGGKQVTLVTGFIGTERDLKELGKVVKSKCGVGGSAKNAEIIIQGDHRDKILGVLEKEGYSAKKIGG